MKYINILFLLCIAFVTNAQVVNSSQEFLKSKDSPEIAMCTAAALQMQTNVKIYSAWFEALKHRYTVIYPQKTAKEVEMYTLERILDKKRRLKEMGYDSKLAALKYFTINCTR